MAPLTFVWICGLRDQTKAWICFVAAREGGGICWCLPNIWTGLRHSTRLSFEWWVSVCLCDVFLYSSVIAYAESQHFSALSFRALTLNSESEQARPAHRIEIQIEINFKFNLILGRLHLFALLQNSYCVRFLIICTYGHRIHTANTSRNFWYSNKYINIHSSRIYICFICDICIYKIWADAARWWGSSSSYAVDSNFYFGLQEMLRFLVPFYCLYINKAEHVYRYALLQGLTLHDFDFKSRV